MATFEQLAANDGMTTVGRGTQYAPLVPGSKMLAVFRGVDWELAALAWIDGGIAKPIEAHECLRGCDDVAGDVVLCPYEPGSMITPPRTSNPANEKNIRNTR